MNVARLVPNIVLALTVATTVKVARDSRLTGWKFAARRRAQPIQALSVGVEAN